MAELTAEQRDDLREEVREKSPEFEPPPSRNPHNRVEDAGEQGEQRFREAVAHAEHERDVGELRQITAARARVARDNSLRLPPFA